MFQRGELRVSTPWSCFATNSVWAHDALERLFFWSRFRMTIQLKVAGRLMPMTRLGQVLLCRKTESWSHYRLLHWEELASKPASHTSR